MINAIEIVKKIGYTIYKENEGKTKFLFGGVDMSKGAKFFTVVAVIIGVLTAAEILGEIFSTKMNRYYKVDSE